MSKINFEEISFQIIAYAGEAKGKAIQAAKQKDFNKAASLIAEAEKSYAIAAHSHMDVVSAEANGEKLCLTALFVHAEDQMLNVETIILLAKEFIEVYQKI
ncbi:PTS system cellobiose-specific IIA component [Spiroplasma clarkii]|uniref:PTS system, cellobiose-specific IIA component n=1 Tax=Spiroplasma clarkii TaxID=2139 RepID=A0A1Y0L0Z4_9MOLU|nr:PTS lactose/cellobiose transporter subunit IIA [Spiroplasma clarkii]ARU91677.1 PTS system cellobiose-specific IIA component [Spiroplasma clarkii]ATX71066.1 PTS system, cellobiose-specific IIA component [Spiroplasma clarkii]